MAVNRGREEWKTYKNVFDSFSEQNLHKLAGQGHFQELESPVMIGKEANVFTAIAEGGKRVIVKIYRLENANFNKMLEYLRLDPRYANMKNGKRATIFSWAQREHRNLLLARSHVRVPTPMSYRYNILVMELIGKPAPQLKNAWPKDSEAFFKILISQVAKLWHGAGLVHGDLSPFNILNLDDKPVLIDFSQASPKTASNAEFLLERDLKNVCKPFGKDPKVFFEKILKGWKGD